MAYFMESIIGSAFFHVTDGKSATFSEGDIENTITRSLTLSIEFRKNSPTSARPVDVLINCYYMFTLTARSVVMMLQRDNRGGINDGLRGENIDNLVKAIEYKLFERFDQMIADEIMKGDFRGNRLGIREGDR